MIILTGAAGFIGSCLLQKLNDQGINNVIIVDDFSPTQKLPNFQNKGFLQKVERGHFLEWLKENNSNEIEFIFHIGARTDTTEFNVDIFNELNLNYSKQIWNWCTQYQVPLVYASSAATYGDGNLGYSDDHNLIAQFKPLNPYGDSKQLFDEWVLTQENTPPFWAGLKFFNVYGPNEYHKGRMASVVMHAFNQIHQTGQVKLFKSHRSDYEDGKQLRDFIYVKDVVDVCLFLMQNQPDSGIYNLGTGKARTFLDLASAVFTALEKSPNIQFIDTPIDIRDKYQYFTQAEMGKLQQTGFAVGQMHSLETGVGDYIANFLSEKNYL